MKKLTYLAIVTCVSCISPPPPKEIKTTTQIKAGQWVSCWELCGKGDKLVAVTETHCKCRNGKSFAHGFELQKKKVIEPTPVEVEPAEPVNILDYLGIKPVGQ